MVRQSDLPLLIVEDSDEDFEMIRRIVQRSAITNPIFRCTDGDEALDFLYHSGAFSDPTLAPRPSLILLDLNLPGTDGRELLQRVKQDRSLKNIPIVVLSTSSNPEDIEICYQNGVNSYILKPIDIKRLVDTIHTFLHYWLEIAILPDAAERSP